MISIWILTLYTFLALSVAGYCEMRTPNSNNSLSIQDCQTFHQIQLNVGTPAISYPFLIDTGSLMTWVPTVDCNCGLGINTRISRTSKISHQTHTINVFRYLFSMLMEIQYLDIKVHNYFQFQIRL